MFQNINLQKFIINKKSIYVSIIGIFGIFLLSLFAGLYRTSHEKFSFIFFVSGILCVLIFFYNFSFKEKEKYYIHNYQNIGKFTFLKISIILLITFILGMILKNIKLYIPAYLLFFIASLVPCFFIKPIKINNSIIIKNKFEITNDINILIILFILFFNFLFIYFISKYFLFYAFITIVIIALLLIIFNINSFYDYEIKEEKFNYIYIFIILFFSIFVRFYMLFDIPPGFDDKARIILNYINELKESKTINIAKEYSLFNIYLLFLLMKLLGYKLEIIRIIQVLLSLGTLFFLYFLIKEIFNKNLAVFTLIFYSFLFLPVCLARVDFPLYFSGFFLIFSIYLLNKAIKNNSLFYFILAGVITAAAFGTSYFLGLIQLIILIIFFLLYGFEIKKIKMYKTNLINFSFFMLSIIIFYIPEILNLFKNLFLSSKLLIKFNIFDYILIFFKNLIEAYYYLLIKGTDDLKFWLSERPVIKNFESILLFIGSAYLLSSINKRSNIFILIFLALSFLPYFEDNQRKVINNFNMILFSLIIPIILSLGVYVIFQLLNIIMKNKFENKLFYLINIILLLLLLLWNLHNDYFKLYSNDDKIKNNYTFVCSKIEKLINQNYKKYKIYISPFWQNVDGVPYFGINADKKYEIMYLNRLKISDFYDANKDVMLIGEGFYFDYFDYLKVYFPDIKINKFLNELHIKRSVDKKFNNYLFIQVIIPVDNIKKLFGLNAKIYKNNKFFYEERFLNDFSSDLYDKMIEITGNIEIPDDKKYRIELSGLNTKIIKINGKKYDGGYLKGGMNMIKIIGNIIKGSKIELYWLYNNNKEKIPISNMIYIDNFFGVVETKKYFIETFYTDDYIVPSINKKIYWFDPFIRYEDIHGKQYNIIWTGFIKIEKDGYYKFRLDTYKDFCGSIEVNNNIVSNFSQNINENKSIKLTSGWYPIKVSVYSFLLEQNPHIFYYKLQIKESKDIIYRNVRFNELQPYIFEGMNE